MFGRLRFRFRFIRIVARRLKITKSPGLLHYIYTAPAEFFPVQNSLYVQVQVLRSRIYWQRYCTALQQRALAKLCGVVQEMELPNFRRRRHLYLRAAITLGIGPHSSY